MAAETSGNMSPNTLKRQMLESIQENMKAFDAREVALKNFKSMSSAVRKNTKALLNNQMKMLNHQVAFYKSAHDMECKNIQESNELFIERAQLVSGTKVPTEEEAKWAYSDDDSAEEVEAVKGVSEFWSTIFQNVGNLRDMIADENDLDALKSLKDMKLHMFDSSVEEPGFQIDFEFNPNSYFTNEILTKRYILQFDLDPENQLDYEGPFIIESRGCVINWCEGKNLNSIAYDSANVTNGAGDEPASKRAKITPSEEVNSSIASSVNDTSYVGDERRSFFNFFSTASLKRNDGDEDDSGEMEEKIRNDYENGHFIKDKVIPLACLYFTGHAVDEDDLPDHNGDAAEEDESASEEEQDGGNE